MVMIGLVVVIAASLLVVFAGAAMACSCLDQSEAELYEGADVVFVAAVVGSTPGNPYVFELSVESVQKGEVPTEATVMVNRSDVEDCLFELAVSDTYQVFAGSTDGTLTTGLCAGTRSLDAARVFAPDGMYAPAPVDLGDSAGSGADKVASDEADSDATGANPQSSPPEVAVAGDAAPVDGGGGGVPLWVLLVAVSLSLAAGYGFASVRSRS